MADDQGNNTTLQKPTVKKFLDVPGDVAKLPDIPWTIASLKERYGEEGGDEMYCRVACQMTEAGCKYFNARADRSFRPDLHP